MSIPLHLSNEELNSLRSLIAYASEPERTKLTVLVTGQTIVSATTADPLSRFCPHRPWPKQQAFLDLTCKEAFYGGAAAGGKSEALLMAALQFVHVPGYAALILRKDTQRLRLAGGLIPRSHQWLSGTSAVWNGMDRRWIFATGREPATISFGYLQDSQDKYRYGSSEYQYIALDELTEFPEEDYLFLFSRLRKTKEIDAPLRMRSASNPGNLGHGWVKGRFISDRAVADVLAAEQADVYWKNDIAFVPARIRDNPAVQEDEYRDSLAHLPPVLRERLMNGDWSVREEGLIRQQWFRYYTLCDRRLQLHNRQGEVIAQIDDRKCRRFATIDPAGTSAQRQRERRGKPPSWSVVQIWEQLPEPLSRFLVLRHVWRGRVGFDGLCDALRLANRQWRPTKMYIENEKLGQAAVDVLGRDMPLQTISTGGRDKVTRAAPLINKLHRGELFLPRYENQWLAEFQAELLAWTGLGDETTDQIDAAAYAAMVAEWDGGDVIRIEKMFW